MSTAMRYPPDYGYAGLTMTADEYLALGETRERYELVHGVVLMSPSPLPIHSLIAMRIQQQLLGYADRTGAAILFADTDVRFDEATVYRPDISVYRTGRIAPTVDRLVVAPDLVVEVLSPSNRGLDLITKKKDYERFGVGEYWVVDPANAGLRVWRRSGQAYQEAVATGDAVESSAIPGFVLDLRPIRNIARP
jgi:Uma2 family endonuclease